MTCECSKSKVKRQALTERTSRAGGVLIDGVREREFWPATGVQPGSPKGTQSRGHQFCTGTWTPTMSRRTAMQKQVTTEAIRRMRCTCGSKHEERRQAPPSPQGDSHGAGPRRPTPEPQPHGVRARTTSTGSRTSGLDKNTRSPDRGPVHVNGRSTSTCWTPGRPAVRSVRVLRVEAPSGTGLECTLGTIHHPRASAYDCKTQPSVPTSLRHRPYG